MRGARARAGSIGKRGVGKGGSAALGMEGLRVQRRLVVGTGNSGVGLKGRMLGRRMLETADAGACSGSCWWWG